MTRSLAKVSILLLCLTVTLDIRTLPVSLTGFKVIVILVFDKLMLLSLLCLVSSADIVKDDKLKDETKG